MSPKHAKLRTDAEVTRFIQNTFSASFMNDSKWDKVVDAVSDLFERGVFVRYKLIFETQENTVMLTRADWRPFFIEPVLYREVEWIEFPSTYPHYVSEHNQKAGKRTYDQDIVRIESVIRGLGEFALETYDDRLRLLAYHR